MAKAHPRPLRRRGAAIAHLAPMVGLLPAAAIVELPALESEQWRIRTYADTLDIVV